MISTSCVSDARVTNYYPDKSGDARVVVTREPVVPPPVKVIVELNELQAIALQSLLYGRVPTNWTILNTIYKPLDNAMQDFGFPKIVI